MNQITTQYITENGACYEQYVITDLPQSTTPDHHPERGGMITGFTLDGDEYIWTRRPQLLRVQPPPLRCAGALPQLRQSRRRRPQL